MKVIFLDVDGVLNNPNTMSRSPDGWVGVSTSLVKRLKLIISETGAKTVLTSTWKHASVRDISFLYQKLGSAKPIDRTYDPEDKDCLRGEGIKSYLNSHDVEEFVILDDFTFDFQKQGLSQHLVWVVEGLTDNDVDRAIKILNGDLIGDSSVVYSSSNSEWGYHR